MHSLHRVLVHIPDIDSYDSLPSKDDVQHYAMECIDGYQGAVFDWRADDAGSWSDEYPESVLYASDDVESFCDELAACMEERKRLVADHLEWIRRLAGTLDLAEIANGEHATDAGWDVAQVGKLINGEYTFRSQVFDTSLGSSLITDDTIQAVRNKPEDWALVLFDCHF